MDLMQTLVAGLCVAIPSVLATTVTSKQNTKLTEYRFNEVKEDINALAKTVHEHNGVVERTSVVENDIKTLYKKVEKLEK